VESENIAYDVVYRKIKHPRIEFKTGKMRIIIAPNHNPKMLAENHNEWVRKKTMEIEDAIKQSKSLTLEERNLASFQNQVDEIVLNHQTDLGVKVNRIRVQKLNSKWGSYSVNRNLLLNTDLMKLPIELIDYVIYHELTHGIERKHDDKFWKLIERKHPNHQKMERDLFSYWFALNKKVD
jgi:predicted metal-dependent hydrolase